MKIITEQNLVDFKFWSGAVEHAKMLTASEMDYLQTMIEEFFPNGMDETDLNDWFWFDFDQVCEWLNLQYDYKNDKIVRD